MQIGEEVRGFYIGPNAKLTALPFLYGDSNASMEGRKYGFFVIFYDGDDLSSRANRVSMRYEPVIAHHYCQCL
jgi:hypothetical protein